MVPGHLELAGAGLDGGDDLGGDAGVDVGTFRAVMGQLHDGRAKDTHSLACCTRHPPLTALFLSPFPAIPRCPRRSAALSAETSPSLKAMADRLAQADASCGRHPSGRRRLPRRGEREPAPGVAP